jgi:Effector-associated domain 11
MDESETPQVLGLVRNFIGEGNTLKALEMIEGSSLSRKERKQFYVIKSRFSNLKNQYNLGIITERDFNQELNKINLSILEFVDTCDVTPRNSIEYKQKYFIISIITLLVIGIGIFLFFKNEQKDSFYIHLYQFVEPNEKSNYDELALKFVIAQLNSKIKDFEIIIHDSETINSEKLSDKNYDDIFRLLNQKHQFVRKNEGIAALVNFRLYSNYFSVTNSKFTVFSIWGLDSEEFEIKNFNSFILKFVSLEIIRTSTIMQLRQAGIAQIIHFTNESRGCLFDYMYDKREIINSLDIPNFCAEHEKMINEKLGLEKMKLLQELISYKWLDEPNTKNTLLNRFKIKME